MRVLEKILSVILLGIFSIHMLSILGIYFDTLYFKVLFLILEIVIASLLGFVYSFNKEHHMKKRSILAVHKVIFILYIISLIDVLFLSSDLHRSASLMADYSHMNTVPFGTIRLYLDGYAVGSISLENCILNLLGNFILFMPLAYFLPFYMPTQRKWYYFLMLMISLTLVIEIIQINLSIGSADIDDIILNVTGAMLFYGITQLTFSKYIYRILGRE